MHNIDIANWVMSKGGDPRTAHPVEANGMGGRVNRGNYGDIFDHHFVEFTYADGTKVYQPEPASTRHVGPGERVRPRHRRAAAAWPTAADRSWKAATPTCRSTWT